MSISLACGRLAQMVERSLCMREVLGSIPRLSINIFLSLIYKYILNNIVLHVVNVNKSSSWASRSNGRALALDARGSGIDT